MGRLADLNIYELVAIASVQKGIILRICDHVFIEGRNNRAGSKTDGKRIGIGSLFVAFRISRRP